MKIESKANGRVMTASGVSVLLADEAIWDLAIEDLTYRFTFNPTFGNPRVEHLSTTGKHAEMQIVGGLGSLSIAIHLPNLAYIGGVPYNLSFHVAVLGEHPACMRAISYSVNR